MEVKNIEYNVYNLKQEKKQVKKILLACHGFDSSKDSNSIRQIANGFSEIDMPIISFDWAGHGDNTEELTIKNCINIFKTIEEEILKEFPNAQIFLYGSSFGAYMILLLYSKGIIDNKYPYCFLKSPAIKMDEIFKEKLIEEDFEEFKKRGYTIKNRNKKMIIPYKFYEELCENKLKLENFKNNIQSIIIFHGTDDDIASIEETKMLTCDNIQLVKIPGAPHSFKGKYLDEMIQKMIEIILQDSFYMPKKAET